MAQELLELDARAWSGELQEVNRMVERFVLEFGREAEKEVRTAAGVVAVELCLMTFPRGTGKEPPEVAKRVIAADVAKVFATSGEAYGYLEGAAGAGVAQAFGAAVAAGRRQQAQKILAESGGAWAGVSWGAPQAAEHEAARTGARRRVVAKVPRRIVTDKQREAYTAKRWKQIGAAASGWAWVARMLKTSRRRVPAWKNTGRHRRQGGEVRRRWRPGVEAGVVLCNRIDYVKRNLRGGLVAAALANGARTLRKRLGAAVAKAERKRARGK